MKIQISFDGGNTCALFNLRANKKSGRFIKDLEKRKLSELAEVYLTVGELYYLLDCYHQIYARAGASMDDYLNCKRLKK